jgi:hypothetical protein
MKQRSKEQRDLIGRELCELERILNEYYARLLLEAHNELFQFLPPKEEILAKYKKILEKQKLSPVKRDPILYIECSSNWIHVCANSVTIQSYEVDSLEIKNQEKTRIKKFTRRFEAVRELKAEVTNLNHRLVTDLGVPKKELYDEFKLVSPPLLKIIDDNQPTWWEKPLIEKLKALLNNIVCIISIRVCSCLFPSPNKKLANFREDKQNIQTYAVSKDLKGSEDPQIKISI